MKEVDDIVYEVNCTMVTIKKGADVGMLQIMFPEYSSPMLTL
jgi:hypothetical protein